MLGLTTDPSPHGLKNREKSKGGQDDEKNMQVSKRGEDSIVPGLKSDFFTKFQSDRGQEEDDDSDSEDEKLNTIKGRNRAAAKEVETLVWRALCDKPKSALKYIAKDAIISNHYLFGDSKPRSSESEPTLEESLKDAEEWMAYKMHDPQVVEIDLMAVAISYRVTLFKQVNQRKGGSGLEASEGTVSSSWRQCASGDWELCSMLAA